MHLRAQANGFPAGCPAEREIPRKPAYQAGTPPGSPRGAGFVSQELDRTASAVHADDARNLVAAFHACLSVPPEAANSPTHPRNRRVCEMNR